MQEVKVVKNGTEVTIKELTKKEYKKIALTMVRLKIDSFINKLDCNEDTEKKIREICSGDKFISVMVAGIKERHLQGEFLSKASEQAFDEAWESLVTTEVSMTEENDDSSEESSEVSVDEENEVSTEDESEIEVSIDEESEAVAEEESDV